MLFLLLFWILAYRLTQSCIITGHISPVNPNDSRLQFTYHDETTRKICIFRFALKLHVLTATLVGEPPPSLPPLTLSRLLRTDVIRHNRATQPLPDVNFIYLSLFTVAVQKSINVRHISYVIYIYIFICFIFIIVYIYILLN